MQACSSQGLLRRMQMDRFTAAALTLSIYGNQRLEIDHMNVLQFVRKMTLAWLLLGIVVTSSFAQEADSISDSPAAKPALPPVQSQGKTEFVTGGIGRDESELMKKEARAWPLLLELTQARAPRPEYISDVQITIKDKSGNTVLDATADGPYMLIRLAPGRYSLDATYESVTLHRDLNLEKGQSRKIALVWPTQKQGSRDKP